MARATREAGWWGWDGRATLALVTVAVVALHLAIERSAGPFVVADEAGYLGNARWLAGQDPVFAMGDAPFYAWGYSAVIAPVHWLVHDPGLRWDAILAVDAVLLGSLVPLLYAVARRVLGVGARTALLAAGVGALCPGVLGTGGGAVAENLSLPLVVLAVLALHAMLASPRLAPRMAFGPVVAALHSSHPRYAPVVVLVGVALVLALVVGPWRRLVPRVVALGNLVGLALGVLVVRLVDQMLVEARWNRVDRIEGGGDEVLTQLTTTDGLYGMARSTLGQGWYLVVGTLGIAVVGLVAVLRITAGRGLGGRGGGGGGAGRSPTVAARVTAGATVLMALALAAVSVYFFARTELRDDHLIYGRHNESFVPLWVAAGVATILEVHTRALSRTLVGAAAVLAAVSAAVIAVLDPAVHGGRYNIRAVPSLSRALEGPASEVFVRGSIIALVGLTVVALASVLVRRPVLAVALVAAWFVWASLGRIDAIEAPTEEAYRGWDVPEAFARLGVEEAALDVRAAPVALVTYQFALPEVRFEPYLTPRDPRPDAAFVVGSSIDAELAAEGAQLVLVDDSMPAGRDRPAPGLWVLPGPEQDALDAAGRLGPR